MPRGTSAGRPVVLVLGGGFAGIGAARKLKDADVDVVLVDQHDYHTFQPLLYQVATGLLETTRRRPRAPRPLPRPAQRRPSTRTTVTAIDLAHAQVQLRGDGAARATTTSSSALGAEVNFFGTKGAAEHALPDVHARRRRPPARSTSSSTWEAADRNPALVEDGALNVVVVGGGPTGVESAGALAELYRGDFAKDYPGLPQDKARMILVEAGPSSSRCSSRTSARTRRRRSRSAASR